MVFMEKVDQGRQLYCILLQVFYVRMQAEFILMEKKIPLELTYLTANVNGIVGILEKDYGISDPILLDAKFEQIRDEKFTRGL